MTAPPKRRWFRCAFSLRTLFVLVAIVGFYFGIQRNRVRQRHAFLTAESAILKSHGLRISNREKQRDVDAPWPLGWFGEKRQLVVEFYTEGIDRDHMTIDDCEKAIQARRLFPESEIKLYHENGNGNRGFRFWTINASQ